MLAVAAMALVGAAVAPLPAGADQTTVTGSWYSATQPDPLPPPVGTPATVPAADVPTGDFVVAARPAPQPPDQSLRETYLHVDLSAVTAGSQLNGLTLTLKEDAPPAANANQAAAVIEAHLVTDFFADGATGAPYSQKPKYGTGAVKGARSADGSWVFDLGSLVNGKTTTELQGIALVPAPAAPTDGFQVVWAGQGTSAPVATFTAAPPAGSASTDNGGFAAAPSSSDSFSSEPSSVTPSESFGSSGSFLATPPAASVATPSTPAAPTVAAPTVAAAPKTVPPVRRAVAARSRHGISWLFLPAAIGLLVLLGGAAVSLGQAGEPIPPREGSVVRRLERPVDAPA